MASSRAWWWIVGAGVAGVGAALLSAVQENSDAEATVAVQTQLASFTGIPYRTRRWAQSISAAAVKTAPSGVDPGEWALVNAGKVDREALGGDALRPTGPAGTGDLAPRKLSRVPVSLQSMVVPVGTDKDGNTLVMPGDGLGWGRGLSQIDWMSHEFARTGDWRDPTANLLYGESMLAALFEQWRSDPSAYLWGDGNLGVYRLALAAYNAGSGAVKAALNAGHDPDSVTDQKNYSSDVLRRAGLTAPMVA